VKLIVALLFLSPLCSAHAELWMPSIFASGMVLQADKPIALWGEAEPGSKVTVDFAGQKKTSVADASKRWKVVLDPMPVSNEARTLSATSVGPSATTLQFTGVLVGEVWILAGQSNMVVPLKIVTGGPKDAQTADYPWLHVFTQARFEGASDKPAHDVRNGAWSECSPAVAREMSGVGFYFATALHSQLPNTPIALIHTATGATFAECWMDTETLLETPATSFFRKWSEEALAQAPTNPNDKSPLGPMNYRRPSALFNGKIAPLQPLAVRGVVWYQGEGNAKPEFREGYSQTLQRLIESWRRSFADPKLPFLIVQLPRWEPINPLDSWPTIRAAQAQVARQVPGVELAVMIDLGKVDNIHPPDKAPIGRRLASLAAAKVYGKNIPYSGPVLKKAERQEQNVLLYFEFGQGLSFRGGEAKGFELAETDGKFAPAQAEILKDGTIRVFSVGIPQPTAVRYGWFNWGEVSLYNADKLPAAPFEATF
jgi:sialate O-acetylesterase